MNDEIILNLGDRGSLVNKLQEKLGVEITTIYDNMTMAAVKNFQATQIHVYPNGIVDSITWNLIFTIDGEKFSKRQKELLRHSSKVVELLKDEDKELYEMSLLLQKYISDYVGETIIIK